MADIYEETRCEIVALQPRYQIWHALEQSLITLCLIFLMHPLGVLQYMFTSAIHILPKISKSCLENAITLMLARNLNMANDLKGGQHTADLTAEARGMGSWDI